MSRMFASRGSASSPLRSMKQTTAEKAGSLPGAIRFTKAFMRRGCFPQRYTLAQNISFMKRSVSDHFCCLPGESRHDRYAFYYAFAAGTARAAVHQADMPGADARAHLPSLSRRRGKARSARSPQYGRCREQVASSVDRHGHSHPVVSRWQREQCRRLVA